jgi:hypothetical protein
MVKNFIASKGSASIDLLFNWATAVGVRRDKAAFPSG